MVGAGEILPDFLHIAEPELFRFPLFAEAGELPFLVGDFAFDLFKLVAGGQFGLVGQLAGGQFELPQSPLDLVDFRGHAFQFHGEPAGGFVH